MKKLVIALVSLSLLAATVLAQRDGGARPDRQSPGVLTAPGGRVVNVPSASASEPAAAPCDGAPRVRVAVVVKGVANLRDRANIAGAVVAEARHGAALVIEGEDGLGSPWYRVTDVLSGRQGWVHGNVIKIVYQK